MIARALDSKKKLGKLSSVCEIAMIALALLVALVQ